MLEALLAPGAPVLSESDAHTTESSGLVYPSTLLEVLRFSDDIALLAEPATTNNTPNNTPTNPPTNLPTNTNTATPTAATTDARNGVVTRSCGSQTLPLVTTTATTYGATTAAAAASVYAANDSR